MTRMRDFHTAWMKDDEYRQDYDALEEEFAQAHALARAQGRADARGIAQVLASLPKQDRAVQSKTGDMLVIGTGEDADDRNTAWTRH